jgi:hypothetical protein
MRCMKFVCPEAERAFAELREMCIAEVRAITGIDDASLGSATEISMQRRMTLERIREAESLWSDHVRLTLVPLMLRYSRPEPVIVSEDDTLHPRV